MTSDPCAGIVREESGSGGVYRLTDGGSTAEMSYSRASQSLIIIDHTEVPETMRGQGVGNRLLQCAIAEARANGGLIFPLCPFAAAQFRRHPEYRDVLKR